MDKASDTVTVHIPFSIRKRGGRKLILAPDGTATGIQPRHRIDNAMVKALARGFRWRKLLDDGVYRPSRNLPRPKRSTRLTCFVSCG